MTQTIELDQRYVCSLEGKEYVLYAGLLDHAHSLGLKSLEVEVICYPDSTNHQKTICRARLEGKDGKVFSEIGDADTSNVDSDFAPHLVRVAATRAKARALRDFCNIAIVCVEELGTKNATTTASFPAKPQQNRNGYRNGRNGNTTMTDAQRKAIQNLASRKRVSERDLSRMIADTYSCNLDSLTKQQASSLIQTLQDLVPARR